MLLLRKRNYQPSESSDAETILPSIYFQIGM